MRHYYAAKMEPGEYGPRPAIIHRFTDKAERDGWVQAAPGRKRMHSHYKWVYQARKAVREGGETWPVQFEYE